MYFSLLVTLVMELTYFHQSLLSFFGSMSFFWPDCKDITRRQRQAVSAQPPTIMEIKEATSLQELNWIQGRHSCLFLNLYLILRDWSFSQRTNIATPIHRRVMNPITEPPMTRILNFFVSLERHKIELKKGAIPKESKKSRWQPPLCGWTVTHAAHAGFIIKVWNFILIELAEMAKLTVLFFFLKKGKYPVLLLFGNLF